MCLMCLYFCFAQPMPMNDVCIYIYIYIFKYLSYIYIINNWEIPNVTRKGGSKYRAHQGNGTIWKMFLFSVVSFCSQKIYIYI